MCVCVCVLETHSRGLCCFSLWDPGGLRELLSARGRDGGLIRLLVCGDQAAGVNQTQADPSPPGGVTLSPAHRHTPRQTQQQQQRGGISSHTPTLLPLVSHPQWRHDDCHFLSPQPDRSQTCCRYKRATKKPKKEAERVTKNQPDGELSFSMSARSKVKQDKTQKQAVLLTGGKSARVALPNIRQRQPICFDVRVP